MGVIQAKRYHKQGARKQGARNPIARWCLVTFCVWFLVGKIPPQHISYQTFYILSLLSFAKSHVETTSMAPHLLPPLIVALAGLNIKCSSFLSFMSRLEKHFKM